MASKKIVLTEADISWLITEMPLSAPVSFSFGSRGMTLDPDVNPLAAKLLQENWGRALI